MENGMLSQCIIDAASIADRVSLPGFGVFHVKSVPSSFTDRGYVITPPWRKLSFIFDADATDDGMLSSMTAKIRGISIEEAHQKLESECKSLKMCLRVHGKVDLEGLGTIEKRSESHYVFTEADDLDICPCFSGMESVSIRNRGTFAKSDNVQNPSQDTARPSSRENILSADENVPEVNPRQTLRPAKKRLSTPVIAVACVAGAFAIFLLFLFVAGRHCPEIVDPLLYDSSQLQIIRDLGL